MTRQGSNFFLKISKNFHLHPHPINKIFKNDTTCLSFQSHYHHLGSLWGRKTKAFWTFKIDQGAIENHRNYFKSPWMICANYVIDTFQRINLTLFFSQMDQSVSMLLTIACYLRPITIILLTNRLITNMHRNCHQHICLIF